MIKTIKEYDPIYGLCGMGSREIMKHINFAEVKAKKRESDSLSLLEHAKNEAENGDIEGIIVISVSKDQVVKAGWTHMKEHEALGYHEIAKDIMKGVYQDERA
ncbi:hypothetical protein ACT7DA_21085 [Bacillus pacificus]